MQDRLSGLVLISIEQETAREVDFENLIDMFAEQKARKKKFCIALYVFFKPKKCLIKFYYKNNITLNMFLLFVTLKGRIL